MKTNKVKLALIFLLAFGISTTAEAQILKKLTKKAEQAVTRKLEKKTEEETNKTMDTILGNKGNKDTQGQTVSNGSASSDGEMSNAEVGATEQEEITMYKKSDWVPGETLILVDDFADDPVGDFPQLWNTKGSGELVTLSDNPKKKWLKMYNYTKYEPDLPKDLPKDFTVEYEVRAFNIDDKTSQTAMFGTTLGDGKAPLKPGRHFAHVKYSPFLKWKKDLEMRAIDYDGGGELAAGRSQKDIRQAFKDGMHVGISVKGKRFRVYIDGDKVFDAPRAVNDAKNFSSIIFDTYGLRDDQAILVTNLRIAEGLPEPREKLFKTGSYSTTAITFDVDSDQLKPEAYGILKEIAEAINSEKGKNISITGHTDSDGSDEHNMDLSNRRAMSVKNALVNDFGVDASSLTTDGKGESQPVAGNDSANNKAKNRRTEFKVI